MSIVMFRVARIPLIDTSHSVVFVLRRLGMAPNATMRGRCA